MAEELSNIKFRDIIAAPLTAIVDAGVIAAKATNDFIRTIGFQENTGSPAEDLGKLRTVTFSYVRYDVDNNPARFQIEVPLLSIMPIPCMEVKSANIEFSVNIVGIENTVREIDVTNPDSARTISKLYPVESKTILNTKVSSRLSATARKAQLEKLIERNPILNTGKSLTVELARTEKTNNEVTSKYDMKVNIHIEQADIPAGLAKMFTIMEEAILEQKKP